MIVLNCDSCDFRDDPDNCLNHDSHDFRINGFYEILYQVNRGCPKDEVQKMVSSIALME